MGQRLITTGQSASVQPPEKVTWKARGEVPSLPYVEEDRRVDSMNLDLATSCQLIFTRFPYTVFNVRVVSNVTWT